MVLRKNTNGYIFSEALKVAQRRTKYPNKTNLKVVYGTRTNKFHFVMSDDRDYDTSFAMDLYNFQKIKSSNEAKRLLSGRIIHR